MGTRVKTQKPSKLVADETQRLCRLLQWAKRTNTGLPDKAQQKLLNLPNNAAQLTTNLSRTSYPKPLVLGSWESGAIVGEPVEISRLLLVWSTQLIAVRYCLALSLIGIILILLLVIVFPIEIVWLLLLQ